MKRRASKGSPSSRSKKSKSSSSTQLEQYENISDHQNDENKRIASAILGEEHDDDFNPDLYNVEELMNDFENFDEQIFELERKRQEVLRLLKIHPLTRIKYSTVNRWEKTKEMRAGSQFHSVSADCLGIILSFLYSKEMLDVESVKKICSLSTNFNKALLQYTPFILSLNKEIINFKSNNIPLFGGLYGVEVAPHSENIRIVEALLKQSNYSINYLSIRCDLTSSGFPTLSKEAKESIGILKFVENRNQTRAKLDISHFTSLRDAYISKFKSGGSKITFPSKALSRLSFSFPNCGATVDVEQLLGVSEHLTLCLPNCYKAAHNISDHHAKAKFSRSTTSTMTLLRFKSNSKKPDVMENLTLETSFINKNSKGDFDIQDTHITTATITDITNKLQKEFNFPLEITSNTDTKETHFSNLYIERFTSTILD